ncbi:MAG TPA: hypothetical protein VHM91_00050 [Verrucomicrobiales bacterium]|nr:hypothetical protein [Verrucomicrobiales bacterium]
MSEPPGNNSRPRNPRGGRNRSRGKGNREPRREQEQRDNRRDDRQENRRPKPRNDRRRDRDRRGPRQENRPSPQAPNPTVWQKLLTVLTFGLVRGKSPSKPASGQQNRPKQSPPSSPRVPRQTAAIPPADPDAVDTERLHVGNLSYDATESDLLDLFKGIGNVQNVDIVYNGRTHRSKGFGFVQMMSVTDARRAVAELHGKSFMGRLLQLGPARSRGRDEREADDDSEA